MPSPINVKQLPFTERRRSPRCRIPDWEPVVVGVAVPGGGSKKARNFTGRALDISATGLAILLPPKDSCGELTVRDRALIVVFTLPNGTINLRAAVARCGTLDEGSKEQGFVVGVYITEINDRDQRLLDEYLRARIKKV